MARPYSLILNVALYMRVSLVSCAVVVACAMVMCYCYITIVRTNDLSGGPSIVDLAASLASAFSGGLASWTLRPTLR